MTQAKEAPTLTATPPVEVVVPATKEVAPSKGAKAETAGKAAASKSAKKETKEKTTKSRRRATTKKKHYTEDSIRLYLQEIGRIRLLRADEEIELARQIADLLELERIRDDIADGSEEWEDPEDVPNAVWAEEVKMSLEEFLPRLHKGRRAKDKMV
ncbi:MAG: sigma-70 factor domain-containing protein, partial [Cyanobacteria bacterium J06648_11]